MPKAKADNGPTPGTVQRARCGCGRYVTAPAAVGPRCTACKRPVEALGPPWYTRGDAELSPLNQAELAALEARRAHLDGARQALGR